MGLNDEAEVQKVMDFFSRFGCKQIFQSYPSNLSLTIKSRFIANLCNYVTDDNGKVNTERMYPVGGYTVGHFTNPVQEITDTQGFFSKAKKVGSKCTLSQARHKNMIYKCIGALCKAAFKKDPTALAEGATALAQMDEVEIQRFMDFLKRFGCKHSKISGYSSMIIFFQLLLKFSKFV